MKHQKYQRIKHLPFSPGVQSDDKVQKDLSHLRGRKTVVTTKMDGENTSMYKDGIHARSLDGAYHPSQAYVKSIHGGIAHMIPHNVRICGENLYAVHSLKYNDLRSYFQVFGIYSDGICLSWPETVESCDSLGLTTVPVLRIMDFDEQELKKFATEFDTEKHEGFVIRLYDEFPEDETQNILKWVRPNHVQTGTKHWSKGQFEVNKLGNYGI